MFEMMPKKFQKVQSNFQFNTEDLILYVLGKIPPEKATKMFVNKIAFLAEFSYKFRTWKELSHAQYAAIDHGPVIDNYKKLFTQMQKDKKLYVHGHMVVGLTQQSAQVPEEIKTIIDPVIEYYSHLRASDLRAITHQLDSYIITSKNGSVKGNIIDKDLAHLDILFADKDIDLDEESDIDPEKLPVFDHSKLKPYEFKYV